MTSPIATPSVHASDPLSPYPGGPTIGSAVKATQVNAWGKGLIHAIVGQIVSTLTGGKINPALQGTALTSLGSWSGGLFDGLLNGLNGLSSGGPSSGGQSASMVQAAAAGQVNNITQNAAAIASLSAIQTNTTNSGNSVSVDFSGFSNGVGLGPDFDLYYSGSGTGQIGISSGHVVWLPVNDHSRAMFARYNQTNFTTDYQRVGVAYSSAPGNQVLLGNGYDYIYARMNATADSYVYVSLGPSSLSCGCMVSGNVQTISLVGSPTGGTFTLSLGGLGFTAPIAWNASASALQSALILLVGSTVSVTGGGGTAPWVVTFSGALAGPQPTMTFTSSLTGGTSPTLLVISQVAQTVFGSVSGFTFSAGAAYWLNCGDTGSARNFDVYQNNVKLATFTDSGAISGMGPLFRSAGIGTYATANGLATAMPGAMVGFVFADNTPASILGSGFQASRTATGAASMATGANVFPASYFNTVNVNTSDMTYDVTTNKVTVSVTGWYEVVVNQHGNSSIGSGGQCRAALFKNGTLAQLAVPVNATLAQGFNGFAGSFPVYLQAGDYIQPGYRSDFSGSASVLYGETTGTYTWFSVSLMNISKNG